MSESTQSANRDAEASAPSDPIQQLRAERDEANAKYLRALADFQNYQRRSAQNESRTRIQGIAALAREILPAIDSLDMALAQAESASPTQGLNAAPSTLIAGVRIVRNELLKGLAANGVTVMEVPPNSEFDPTRHEALMYVDVAPGIQPGHIASILKPGYILGDLVIRPAKVAIARPAAADAAAGVPLVDNDGKD